MIPRAWGLRPLPMKDGTRVRVCLDCYDFLMSIAKFAPLFDSET